MMRFLSDTLSFSADWSQLFQGKMIMQDKLEKERNDAKNNVEEYVYDMRDKLHGVLEKFVNEAVSTDEAYYHTTEHSLYLEMQVYM